MRVTESLILALATIYPLAKAAAVDIANRGIIGAAARVAGAVAAAELITDNNNDNTDHSSQQSSPAPKISYSCSADSSKEPASLFAQNPAWGNSMSNCLQQLNNTGWNGDECQPGNGNGTVLGGVTFGFYKNDDGGSFAAAGLQGDTCFKHCHDCLTTGINAHRGVTTSCTYGQDKAKCEMGFNYGT